MDPEKAWALGEVVRRHRKRQHLSHQALADAAGLSKAVINKIESGKARGLQVETLCRVATVFGTIPQAILDEAERIADQRRRIGEMVPIYPSTLTDAERSQFEAFMELVRERISREGKARERNSILSYPNDNSPTSRFSSSVAGASPHLV